MKYKEGDLILCKVKKVTNTITFVELPNSKEGTIISSEIAAGRIKLMRQYVVPNKQIVCKILKLEGDHAHLSLRRVNAKERSEVMQKAKQTQAIKTAFKQILKDEESEIKEKILKDFEDLYDFATKAKTDETLIQKYIPSKFQEQLGKIINKKRKNEQFKKIIQIKCLESDGLNKIKNTLDIKNDKAKTTYITAGKFSLHLEVSDPKQGKKEMQEITEELEKKAKKNNCEIFITDDK
jgi:translation initiation factor 2 alpha subunit (eIF-2alpha)